MGRAGFVNDEIGSALIGSRLVRDIMRLTFLMEREYPPYAKWFGTAFSCLKSGGSLAPVGQRTSFAVMERARITPLLGVRHVGRTA